MQPRVVMFFVSIVIIVGMATLTVAQDISSPTPAPSKTPMATAISAASPTGVATATPSVARATPSGDEETLRRYTQADLNILVGNVQRPNGIVWLNNNLYTVCSGDFTLYEVNSETGATITFVSGIRDANMLLPEETENGFNLWIPDFDTNQVLRVSDQRGLPQVVVRENLDGPWGIAVYDEERFLVTNALANNIVLAGRDGSARIVVDGLRYPTGIVVADDYGYVANRGSARRAIEWFELDDIDPERTHDDAMQPLVAGLQNVANLVLAEDGYLYFTYALAERGVVGRVDPVVCRDNGCTNEHVEIVVLTDGRTAPLAGLAISPDMRLFVHTAYEPEIFWVQLYD